MKHIKNLYHKLLVTQGNPSWYEQSYIDSLKVRLIKAICGSRKLNPNPDSYELDARENLKEILQILTWISEGNKPRDLGKIFPSIPSSLTSSTLGQDARNSIGQDDRNSLSLSDIDVVEDMVSITDEETHAAAQALTELFFGEKFAYLGKFIT